MIFDWSTQKCYSHCFPGYFYNGKKSDIRYSVYTLMFHIHATYSNCPLGLWTICTQPVVIIGENEVQEKTQLKNLGDSIPARSGVLDLWHWAMSY